MWAEQMKQTGMVSGFWPHNCAKNKIQTMMQRSSELTSLPGNGGARLGRNHPYELHRCFVLFFFCQTKVGVLQMVEWQLGAEAVGRRWCERT